MPLKELSPITTLYRTRLVLFLYVHVFTSVIREVIGDNYKFFVNAF